MALDVKIVSGATTFYLKASDWSLGYSRPVTAVALPGDNRFILDLGRTQPEVRVSGTCNKDPETVDPTIADRADFETMLTWYNSTIYLYENASKRYEGKIKSLILKRQPEQDYFTFELIFVVKTIT
jgi:hypothetical protein